MFSTLAPPSWLSFFESSDHEHDLTFDTDRIPKKRKVLVCVACGSEITSEESRIEVRGSHEHSFFNPHGIVFRIGCFSDAAGCRPMSPSSSEFSWFPGFTWVIVSCHSCQNHLGWSFAQTGQIAFYGLILNQLTDGQSPES